MNESAKGCTARGAIAGGILILVVGLSATFGGDEPRKFATPNEEFEALGNEFFEATQANLNARTDEERKKSVEIIEKLPLRLLELAEKHPRDPIALDALVQVVKQEAFLVNNSTHPGWGKDSRQARALAILTSNHFQSDRLAEACQRAAYGFRPECETFLRAVLEKNPHKDIQGLACLRLAQFLQDRGERLNLLKGQPDMAKRYEGLFGKAYLETLRRQDAASSVKEAEALYERAIGQYGAVKVPFQGTVGEVAKSELYEIRHLSVGKVAPETIGVDQEGQRFKLSDYRGKVVLVYFWQQFCPT